MTLQMLLASSATAPQFAQKNAGVSFGTGTCFFSDIECILLLNLIYLQIVRANSHKKSVVSYRFVSLNTDY
jgi:hypothetical protein